MRILYMWILAWRVTTTCKPYLLFMGTRYKHLKSHCVLEFSPIFMEKDPSLLKKYQVVLHCVTIWRIICGFFSMIWSAVGSFMLSETSESCLSCSFSVQLSLTWATNHYQGQIYSGVFCENSGHCVSSGTCFFSFVVNSLFFSHAFILIQVWWYFFLSDVSLLFERCICAA